MTSKEPHWTTGSDPALLFARYLDFYREKAIEKVLTLPSEEQSLSRVPSLWTPLQLLHHLAYMEQRWFVWGFLAEQVAEPFGDEVNGLWGVPRGPGRGPGRGDAEGDGGADARRARVVPPRHRCRDRRPVQ